jgi:predicted nucleic acid-binding protein
MSETSSDRLVVDPSAIVALALEDEDPQTALRVLGRIGSREGLAPPLFWYELRNVLMASERRGRITRADTDRFLSTFAVLPLEIAPLPSGDGIMALARKHELSIYDAAYLDLALENRASLATLDKKLQGAAIAAGVSLWPPGGEDQPAPGLPGTGEP